jgi:hypothetical protein
MHAYSLVCMEFASLWWLCIIIISASNVFSSRNSCFFVLWPLCQINPVLWMLKLCACLHILRHATAMNKAIFYARLSYGYYKNNWLYSLYSKLYSPEYEMNYPFMVLELIAAVLILLCLCLCLCLCDPYPCPWVAFVGFRGKGGVPWAVYTGQRYAWHLCVEGTIDWVNLQNS